jgi:hypothetical protein
MTFHIHLKHPFMSGQQQVCTGKRYRRAAGRGEGETQASSRTAGISAGKEDLTNSQAIAAITTVTIAAAASPLFLTDRLTIPPQHLYISYIIKIIIIFSEIIIGGFIFLYYLCNRNKNKRHLYISYIIKIIIFFSKHISTCYPIALTNHSHLISIKCH